MKHHFFCRIRLLAACFAAAALCFFPVMVKGDIQSAERGSIRVSGLETGLNVTVSVYSVVDVNFNFMTQTLNGYVWAPAVLPFVGAQTPETVGNTSAVDFFDGLAAFVQDPANGVSPVQTVSTSTGDVTISNLELGTYLLLISGGARFYRPTAASVEAVQGNATHIYELRSPEIKVKSIDPRLDGTINSSQLSDGHVPTSFDTAAIRETVTIDVTGDVPSYPAGSAYTNLSFHHVHSAGITCEASSIRFFGVASDGQETPLVSSMDYTLSEDEALGTWTAAVQYDRVKGYARIHAQFFVTLNHSALIGTPAGNESITTYTYTADPHAGTERAKSVTLRLYTYGMKIDSLYQTSGITRPLPGARYQLRRDPEEEATALSLSTAEINGRTVFVVAPSHTNKTMMSDINGEILLYGLPEGNYYLVEVSAPYGFNQSIRPTTVVISKQGTAVPYQLSQGENAVPGIYHVVQPHARSVSMPRSGGLGEIWFYLAGFLMILTGYCRILHLRNNTQG